MTSGITIGGMPVWFCTYTGPDGRYGINLPASDPAQILEDHCDRLPDLRVQGQVFKIIEED